MATAKSRCSTLLQFRNHPLQSGLMLHFFTFHPRLQSPPLLGNHPHYYDGMRHTRYRLPDGHHFQLYSCPEVLATDNKGDMSPYQYFLLWYRYQHDSHGRLAVRITRTIDCPSTDDDYEEDRIDWTHFAQFPYTRLLHHEGYCDGRCSQVRRCHEFHHLGCCRGPCWCKSDAFMSLPRIYSHDQIILTTLPQLRPLFRGQQGGG